MQLIRPGARLFPCAIIFGLLVSSCNCGQSGLVKQNSYIELDHLALDFGPVPLGSSAELPVAIRNLGQRDLLIEAPESDGSDFAGPTESFLLAPGEKVAINVSFAPSTIGARTATLHLLNNSANDPDATIQLIGVGISKVTCSACNMPPANYCAGASTLIVYENVGSCQGNMCLYQSSQTICGGMCNAANAKCDTGSGSDGGSTPSDAGTGGSDAGMKCIDGQVRSCVSTDCGNGGQTCTANTWGACESCTTFEVGAQCINGSCCNPTGAVHRFGATNAIEAAGLSVGVVLTPSFDPFDPPRWHAGRCCSKQARVVGVDYSVYTTYGNWEIRCD